MMLDFKDEYTIVIVTHNLSQARRIADYTAFFLDGELIEYDETEKIFGNSNDQRTKEYVEGVFG